MKISDFKLAHSVLKMLCHEKGVSFCDIPIYLSDEIVDNAIIIGETSNIIHTIYKIIQEYIDRSQEILGTSIFDTEESKNNFFIMLSSKLRSILYKNNDPYEKLGEPTKQKLYNYPFVWISLKDIIGPVFNTNIRNVDVYLVDRNDIDIACYCNNIEYFENVKEPFIFLNDINNVVVQSVFLLLEAIEAHGLCPIKTMKDIYNSDLYSKFYGLLELSFSDEDIELFESLLLGIIGIDIPDFTFIQEKTAQRLTSPDSIMPFWFTGLTEQMLEGVRGYEWSVYESLQPYVEEFWNKVEEIKQKRIKAGKDSGIPFDLLLRLKTKQLNSENRDLNITLQSLLSSNRVW